MKLTPAARCPNCRHNLGYHGEYGCMVGWAWDIDGIATDIGCECNLGIVD